MIGTGLVQRNQVELGSGGGVHADEPPPLILGEQGVGRLARDNRRWVSGSKHEHEKTPERQTQSAPPVGRRRLCCESARGVEARGHAGRRSSDALVSKVRTSRRALARGAR